MVGSGKTSLIHRCAAALKTMLATTDSPAHVVDLRESVFRGAGVKDQDRTLQREFARASCDLPVFKKSTIDEIAERSTDLHDFVAQLSAHRTRNPPLHPLIVLLPPVELEEQCDAWFAAFLRPGFVVFTESSVPAVTSHCARRYGTHAARPVVRLTLSGVSVEDMLQYAGLRVQQAIDRAGRSSVRRSHRSSTS